MAGDRKNRLALLFAAAMLGAGCTTIVYDEDDPWPVDPSAFPQVGPSGALLITNSMSDTLSWIDLATNTKVFDEPVGRVAAEREGPHHGAATADGKTFFIGLSNFVPGSGTGPHGSHGTGTVPGWALKYDAVTKELVGEVEVDRNPGDVRLTPDGSTLLQSHFDLARIIEVVSQPDWEVEDTYSSLAIIDATTMSKRLVPVCPAAHGIGVTPDGATAYVACYASDELAIVDLAATPTVTRVPLAAEASPPTAPQIQPYALAISPVDGSIWVTCPTSSPDIFGSIHVYEPAAGTWRTPIVTVGKPFFPTFSADGSRLYVPEQPNTLSVRDGATGAVQSQLALPDDPQNRAESCHLPHAVWVSGDEQTAYVVCEGDHLSNGTVAIVSLAGAEPVLSSIIEVGIFPDDAIFLAPP